MSTIPTILPLVPTLAKALGVATIAVDLPGVGHAHQTGGDNGIFRRPARDAACKAIIGLMLANGPQSRQIVERASQGDPACCAIIAAGIPAVWRSPAGAVALYREHPTGEVDGIRASRPNPVSLALAALAALAKETKAAPAPAPVAVAQAITHAEAAPAPAPAAQAITHAPEAAPAPAAQAAPVAKGKASKRKAKA